MAGLEPPKRPLWAFRAPFSDAAIEFIRQWAKPGRPGRPPAEYKWEWARRFEEIKVDYLERHEFSAVDGERQPNNMDISLAVAYDDFDNHPERWTKYGPDEKPDTAAHRVWDAVGPLLDLNEETRRRASEIRRQRGL
jgi:hypothetical protein